MSLTPRSRSRVQGSPNPQTLNPEPHLELDPALAKELQSLRLELVPARGGHQQCRALELAARAGPGCGCVEFGVWGGAGVRVCVGGCSPPASRARTQGTGGVGEEASRAQAPTQNRRGRALAPLRGQTQGLAYRVYKEGWGGGRRIRAWQHRRAPGMGCSVCVGGASRAWI